MRNKENSYIAKKDEKIGNNWELYIYIYICVCVCVEMVGCSEYDKMMKISGRMDNSDPYKGFSCYISFLECKGLIYPSFHLFLLYIYIYIYIGK